MKITNFLPVAALLLVGLMSGCNKDQESTFSGETLGTNHLKSATLSSVNLGVAGEFAILSKAGITDVFKSSVTGDIGSSPITGAAILVSCTEVTGTIYSVDATGPLPCRVTNPTRLGIAIGDMQTAYTDAAGRANPDFLNLGAGTIGSDTLTPGLYKWTTGLLIPSDITISGGPNDVWIFQISGPLNMNNGVKINLTGGAQANNIFWQVTSFVTLGTNSHFEGNILGKTSVSLLTGASMNGRILAQTAVSLQMNTVTLTPAKILDTILPIVNSTDPLNNAIGVATNKAATVTFSEEMNPLTINASTFTLMKGTTAVSGIVAYTGTTATFTPSVPLSEGIVYMATISTGAKDLAGNALATNTVFSFTTIAAPITNMAAVNLGIAGNFAILSKTGVTDVYKSAVTGDVGASPITGRSILVSCPEVNGTIYSVDVNTQLPCAITNPVMLTTAVSDMEAAYTDGAGRANPDFTEFGAGNIGGKTLTPGLYKWATGVIIPTDVTISGGPNDVWIFQVAGDLTMSAAMKITLTGGAQAKNIFWVVAGSVTIGTTSHFEGSILGQTSINLRTGASINGRTLAQTAVTLQMNTVTKP